MQLQTLVDTYTELSGQLDELRDNLSAADDSKTAHRRGITSALVSEYQTIVDTFSASVSDNLLKIDDPRTLAGVYLGTLRALNSKFGSSVDKFVDGLVAEAQKNAPTVEKPSEEQVKEWQAQYSQLYKVAKSLVESLRLIDKDNAESYEMPKKLTGARGPRGPRNYTLYSWTINDQPVTADNPLTWIANQYNYDKVKTLRDAIKDTVRAVDDDGNEIKVTFDDARIKFVLGNGDVLVGTRDVVENEPDDDDDETLDPEDDSPEDFEDDTESDNEF